MRKGTLVMLAPLMVLGLAAVAALAGFVVQWLWNALVPELFGGPALTFWQALGLLALSRILFGTTTMRGSHRRHWRRRAAARWRQRWEERLATLTPEERARFREVMHGATPGSTPAGER
ncbi:MAG: hypothetical protein AB7U83_02055 [Vicinamibacterales bacterium]